MIHLSVGKLVGLLEGRGGGGGGHLLLEVEGDVAELLLDVADNLTLSCKSADKKCRMIKEGRKEKKAYPWS